MRITDSYEGQICMCRFNKLSPPHAEYYFNLLDTKYTLPCSCLIAQILGVKSKNCHIKKYTIIWLGIDKHAWMRCIRDRLASMQRSSHRLCRYRCRSRWVRGVCQPGRGFGNLLSQDPSARSGTRPGRFPDLNELMRVPPADLIEKSVAELASCPVSCERSWSCAGTNRVWPNQVTWTQKYRKTLMGLKKDCMSDQCNSNIMKPKIIQYIEIKIYLYCIHSSLLFAMG